MTEEVVGFTKNQRLWFLERDEHRCQMFHFKRGRWVQCKNTKDLQVHHILPRGWCRLHLPHSFNVNGCQNGITLCKDCHVGSKGVHPDTAEALTKYRKGNKQAFQEMMEKRKQLNKQGIPYWETKFDWLFQRRVKKTNLKYLRKNPYPTNGNRGNTGRVQS